MTREPVNDNNPQWVLRGPDAERRVWLDYDLASCMESFDLGPWAVVHPALADALATTDYEAVPDPVIWETLPWRLEFGNRWTLVWFGDGPKEAVPLGPRESVAEAFAHWLVEQETT